MSIETITISFFLYRRARTTGLWPAFAGVLLAVAAPQAAAASSGGRDILIVNASIVDGTGAPARIGAVRVHDGRISAIGSLRPRRGDQVVDAHGLTLAPGFIDTHSHHDQGLDAHRDALAVVSQGVTTIVAGQDGEGSYPLSSYFAALARTPAAINVASYTGHGTLRSAVMGSDYKRVATPAEIAKMKGLLAADMRAGSLGLATGLDYDPGIYSDLHELVALSRTAAAFGGRYISHMRNEGDKQDAAIAELLEIGREAKIPVQISHLKMGTIDRWGQSAKVLAGLDAARAQGIDVTVDVYPYEYWQSDLTVLFPKRDFTDLNAAQYALAHIAPADGMLLTKYDADPSLVGKTIADIARDRGTAPARTYLDLIDQSERAGKANRVIGKSMQLGDVATIILWPHSNICSDGELLDPHPRGAGSFTRILAWMVRDTRQLSLATAIWKMSGLAAKHVGITDRGTIARGQAADLVLFDPATISDRATISDPSALSSGVHMVWVNGVPVFKDGRATGAFPGQAILRHAR